MSSNCKGVSAVLLACGLAYGAEAFVNPAAPAHSAQVAHASTGYGLQESAPSVASETHHEDGQSNLAGLWAGVALGLVVGFAGAVSPAFAQNTFVRPGQTLDKRINMQDLRKESREDQAQMKATFSQSVWDKNISDDLLNRVKKLDVEEEFNGDGVQFKVDLDKVPKFEYPKITSTLNDPAVRIGEDTPNSEVEAKVKAQPIATGVIGSKIADKK
eukprot:TRINITY_DN4748_c0_g3_i2.p2 TRINITY_DN4748_c0_g3~~TRINITY_DN4748_c0_g3_i2.p2  ORF type:complete len:215 (-),score=64.46 TRINITY_DN4748_c0_g3_i2:302-946(-)